MLAYLDLLRAKAAESHRWNTLIWTQAPAKGSRPPEVPHILRTP